MGLFQEYLNSKGNVEKAKVDISGGDPDPKTPPNAPPKGGKPYVAKDGGIGKGGFGDMGDKDMIYKPATDPENKGHAPASIPTAEQVELCTLVADAILKDGSLVEELTYQLKRRGLLGVILAEALQHNESYQHIAEIMSHESYGPTVCDRLVRAMKNEEVAPPFPTA